VACIPGGGQGDLFGDLPEQLAEPGEVGAFRNDGSATMLEGAAAIAPKLDSLRGRVLRLYRELGEMTDGEMVEAYRDEFGGGEYRSLSTRRRELVDRGWIVDTGRTRLNPRTRVHNMIWAATKAT